MNTASYLNRWQERRPLFVALCLFTIAHAVALPDNHPCRTSTTSCTCELWNGAVVNLENDAETNGTAKFIENARSSSVFTYHYNPCFAINTTEFDNSKRASIAAYRTTNETEEYIPLGEQRTAKFWMTEEKTLALNYSAHYHQGNTSKHILFTIFLHCDPKISVPKFIPPEGNDPIQENTSFPHFYAALVSQNACSRRDLSDGLSTGSIILILLLVGGLCYLIVGIMYKVFILGARGNNVLPHAKFWMSLPGLISDGFHFSFSCGCCRRRKYQTLV